MMYVTGGHCVYWHWAQKNVATTLYGGGYLSIGKLQNIWKGAM